MSILSGIPVLNCQSIEATLDFYQQALQFVIVKKREVEGELQWIHLMNGSTTLMLQRTQLPHNQLEQSQYKSITLYFYVSNINSIHEFLKAKYGINSKVLNTKYHMHECEVCDPEGNNIMLGQKIERHPEA
jgi:catechol 2,3-dioxygenase-like lactoylglutathione lyase family enzyme